MFHLPCTHRLCLAALISTFSTALSISQSLQIDAQGNLPRNRGLASALENHATGRLRVASEPVNFVIHCKQDVMRMDRFHSHMEKAGLSYEIFPCVLINSSVIDEAVHDGYFLGAYGTYHSEHANGFMGVALAHMKLLQHIVDRNIQAANIFEDDEVVTNSYRTDRQKLLQSLPTDAEFVNLDSNMAEGAHVPGVDSRLLRMGPHMAPCEHCNYWMSNYIVRGNGAKTLLTHMRPYSPQRQIDAVLLDAIKAGADINAYVYAHDYLSIQCADTSTKEDRNKLKVLLQTSSIPYNQDLAARCCHGGVDECTHYPGDKIL